MIGVLVIRLLTEPATISIMVAGGRLNLESYLDWISG